MATIKKYLHTIDADGNKIVNIILNPLTTVQRTAKGALLGLADEGYVCFDVDLDLLFFWDGVQWINAGGGGTSEMDFIAGENISSGMAVVIWTDGSVYKYDVANNLHAGLTCGIAKTSVLIGNQITVTLTGSIHQEVGSGWLPGVSYFVSTTSILSSTAPTIGIVKKIGTGVDIDTIFINDYPEVITI